jgi:hypothetical protein
LITKKQNGKERYIMEKKESRRLREWKRNRTEEKDRESKRTERSRTRKTRQNWKESGELEL